MSHDSQLDARLVHPGRYHRRCAIRTAATATTRPTSRPVCCAASWPPKIGRTNCWKSWSISSAPLSGSARGAGPMEASQSRAGHAVAAWPPRR